MREYKETRHTLIYKDTSDLSFYSAGIEECRPNYEYGPRIRPYHLIHFVLKGKGTLRINNHEFQLGEGDIFIIPADQSSYYKADSEDPWTYMWVSFMGMYSASYINQILGSIDEPYVVRRVSLSKYREAIAEILKIQDDSTSSYFMANSYLLKIIAYLYEDIDYHEDNLEEYSLADEIKFYLEMNYSKDIKIYEVANNFGIHPNYLTRIFKERFLITPKVFLNELKYKKAKRLLGQTDLSINEVARSIGFEDPLAFTKGFHSRYQLSPTQYKKKVKEENEFVLIQN